MFSVGAEPYNSRAKQLYGGWTLEGAGDNKWAQKEYYRMIARLSGDAKQKEDARKWLRMYKVAIKADPSLKKRTRAAGKPFWNKAILPAMTEVQKSALLDAFLNTPLDERPGYQIMSRLYRKAPFPGASMTAFNTMLGVPYYENTAALPRELTYGQWRTTDDLENAFKTMAGKRSYTAKEVADTFGVTEAAAQAAMDAMKRVKGEMGD